jgi:hypothetical protein
MRVDLLKQQKLHRGDSRRFLTNFLSNLSTYARTMRIAIPLAEEKPDILQTAIRSYIIGIAACLETYFRDLYLHTLERDPALLETALEQIKEKEALAALYRNLSDGMSFPEFAMSRATFQSAAEIDQHYSIFFKPRGFLDSLDEFEFLSLIPSVPRKGLARLRLSAGWRKDLARIFNLRHEFAHDANSKSKVETQEMRSLETTAVLLPQVTAHLEPFKPTPPKGANAVPIILLIADFVSEDWIVSDSPPDDRVYIGTGTTHDNDAPFFFTVPSRKVE